MLQKGEYVRLDDKVEDMGIYCENLRTNERGFFSGDNQVDTVVPKKSKKS
jgi:hypothetical protein